MTKKKNKSRRLTYLVLGLVLVLSLIQLFISHRLATAGETVEELEIRASRLEEKNTLLEEEISQMGSLSQISQKAQKLGFIRTSKILYLTSPIPVALGF